MHRQQGEKFVHALAPGSVWKVFQLVRANFEQFGAGPVFWGGLTAPKRSVAAQAV
jgi:hypothetical protein